jgi:hypothetical protein
MKRWQKLLPALIVGCGLLFGSAFPQLAHSQEGGTNRKMIYMFSADFPPNVMTQYPSPPLQETKFWQMLDRSMSTTSDLALTQSLEDADYQIELRCSGVLNCTKLIVDVKDPKRTLLTTFTVNKYSPYLGLFGRPKLELVSQTLTQKLDEHIQRLSQGGYGYSDH